MITPTAFGGHPFLMRYPASNASRLQVEERGRSYACFALRAHIPSRIVVDPPFPKKRRRTLTVTIDTTYSIIHALFDNTTLEHRIA